MSTITKNLGINALRNARQSIEDMLAAASIQMTEDAHTIQAQAVRIGELEESVELLQQMVTAQPDHDTVRDLEDEVLRWRSNARVENNKYEQAREAADYHANEVVQLRAVMSDRMFNVTRLATAASRHVLAGRPAIALQLLSPLTTGVHDAYEYNGTADGGPDTINDFCEWLAGFSRPKGE